MKRSSDLLTLILVVVTIFFFTVGYALYDATLGLNSTLTLKKPGVIYISGVELHEKGDLSETVAAAGLTLNAETGKLDLNYSFSVSSVELDYSPIYLITIKNDSPYDYIFNSYDIQPEVTVNGEAATSSAGATITPEYVTLDASVCDDCIDVGATIPSGEAKRVALKLLIHVASRSSSTIEIVGNVGVNTSTDNSGIFTGGIVGDTVTLDLTSNNTTGIACVDIDVMNTYSNTISYMFSITSSNFVLVDENGDSLGDYTIDPPGENSEDNQDRIRVCLKKASDGVFPTSSAKTQIIINPTGLNNFSAGTVTINVDKDEDVKVVGTPMVSNVTFSALKYDTTNSSLLTKVNWSRTDTEAYDVEMWYVALYSSYNNSVITTFEIEDFTYADYQLEIPSTILTSDAFTTALANETDNSFYIKVYGKFPTVDSGLSYCSSTETNSYCVASSSTSLKYQFTLSYSSNYDDYITMSNITDTTNKQTTVYLNNSFTSVITASSNFSIGGITSVTETVDGVSSAVESGSNGYTFATVSSTEANFTINENVINGDISIVINGSFSGCLVKGTPIKVVDGYKRIEDIKYDDLLVVYSYELGREVYEYPIEIEVEGKSDYYQQITFSDGSILKVYGDHGIFSKDVNKFVSVLDNENFKVGTNVIKISDDGKLTSVRVVNIETIYEKITYYNISSTRYINVIANGFITTDPLLPISNIFSFNEDLTWGNDRYLYLENNDFIPYELLKDYFPRYLYDGIRLGEAKHLLNQGIISISDYVTIFSGIRFVPVPVDSDGNNKWMVTTSYDLENGNKGSYYVEGSFYKLPEAKDYLGKKFIGWYNTSDNKYYREGDLVRVNHGMYFEAIFENI